MKYLIRNLVIGLFVLKALQGCKKEKPKPPSDPNDCPQCFTTKPTSIEVISNNSGTTVSVCGYVIDSDSTGVVIMKDGTFTGYHVPVNPLSVKLNEHICYP